MAIKSLPIGIEDFASACDKYYVDKTLILKDIIDHCFGQSILITRPRRFGKSLMLSMIEYFFSFRRESKSLFSDKKISQCKGDYFKHLNAYPVIRLNMKNITQPNYEEMMSASIEQISGLFRANADVLDTDLFEIEKSRFIDICNAKMENPIDYVGALAFLAEMLFKKYKKKAIILIDEYDTPLENAQQYGFYDKAAEFFKRLYSTTLKANEFAQFALLTGVLQISKESIFSELNNLTVFGPIDQTFNEYFGFSESEVKLALEYFDIKSDINKVREYYSGYGYDGNVYNPWSILNYILNERLDRYWVNSGSNKTINKLIEDIPGSFEALNEFINNKSKTFFYNRAITYLDVKSNYETLFSYLVQTGYLTARPIEDSSDCLLCIPNAEIRSVFENEIVMRNLPKRTFDVAKALRDAVLKGEEDNISHYLKEYVFDQYSYYDKLTNEKDFQMIINGIMGILFGDYLVKPEVNSKFGRCDIMLSPKNSKGPGIVIEIKKFKGKISKSRFEKAASDALMQIKEKEYYGELIRMKTKPILLYAFVFSDYNNFVKAETLKQD